jgi:hypothetical protein
LFVFENFDVIKKFIEKLALFEEESFLILKVLNSEDFEIQLRSIYKYGFLNSSIELLEKNGLSVEEQMKILNDVEKNVKFLEEFSDRWNNILLRNPDLIYFRRFNAMKVSANEKIYSYVPLTTVSVERTFSSYKEIISDRRTNLTVDSMEKLLFLYFNKD